MKNHNGILWIYHKTPPCFAERRCTKKLDFILSFCLGQYRTKIVRQMRRQIFRQMKQKAE